MGELHPAAARFADTVAALARADPHVIRAWIGTVVGYGIHRPDHSYLGPAAPSVEHAARRTAARIAPLELHRLHPLAQLVAIGDHPDLPGRRGELIDAWADIATTRELIG
jgi:hypothetical protein